MSVCPNRRYAAVAILVRRLRARFAPVGRELPLLKAIKGAITAPNCRNLANVGYKRNEHWSQAAFTNKIRGRSRHIPDFCLPIPG
jgi:hypothetical protein